MEAFLVSTAAFLTVLFATLIPKWKSGTKKTFWLGAVFLLSGYVLLCLVSFGYRPTSPLVLFEMIVSFFTGSEVNFKG